MSDRPNVLVVMCDQMRGHAMSCAGDPNVRTPNLDRLAGEGARFENAYSTYPVCVPSRATFVTGRYGHEMRVPSINWQLPPEYRTLADEFREAGYETAWLGKWHLSDGNHNPQYNMEPHVDGYAPVPRELQGGFEYWRGFELRNDPFDTYYYVDDDPTPRRIDGYQTDGLTDLAIEYLRADRDPDRPFFCVLSVEPPHPPYEAPSAYEDRWEDRELEFHPNVDFDPDIDSQKAATPSVIDDLRGYYAMIENLDDNVGRLLDALGDEGLREETAVVFLSDHGDMLGSHGLTSKTYPYEESTRVPLVVSYPAGGIDGGVVRSTPTCSEDWYPTLLALAGIDHGTGPGRNLLPVARDGEELDRPGVMLEFYAELRKRWWGEKEYDWIDETWRGFVTRRYKYTVRGGREGGRPWQLFDLREDPYEQENLIDDEGHVAVARKLHGYLRDRLLETDDDYVLQPAFGHDGCNR